MKKNPIYICIWNQNTFTQGLKIIYFSNPFEKPPMKENCVRLISRWCKPSEVIPEISGTIQNAQLLPEVPVLACLISGQLKGNQPCLHLFYPYYPYNIFILLFTLPINEKVSSAWAPYAWRKSLASSHRRMETGFEFWQHKTLVMLQTVPDARNYHFPRSLELPI